MLLGKINTSLQSKNASNWTINYGLISWNFVPSIIIEWCTSCSTGDRLAFVNFLIKICILKLMFRFTSSQVGISLKPIFLYCFFIRFLKLLQGIKCFISICWNGKLITSSPFHFWFHFQEMIFYLRCLQWIHIFNIRRWSADRQMIDDRCTEWHFERAIVLVRQDSPNEESYVVGGCTLARSF